MAALARDYGILQPVLPNAWDPRTCALEPWAIAGTTIRARAVDVSSKRSVWFIVASPRDFEIVDPVSLPKTISARSDGEVRLAQH